MSWIFPTFGNGGPPQQPPKKKSKTADTREDLTSTSSEIHYIQSSSCNWIELYKPKSVADLVVHVKKVNELQSWLQQCTSVSSRTKFLLITGPPGCGKTTLLQTVCKCSGFKVIEWITPLDKPADFDANLPSRFEFAKSSAKLFEEFVFRSSRYNSCVSLKTTKKLVLVKDFPNVFLHNPSTFSDILENLLEKCINPVVFICSDESICRKLFTTNVKTTCGVHTLALNPIPDQRMLKVVKSILTQECKKSSRVAMKSDDSLMEICTLCQGDLRSAITKLYFLSIKSSIPVVAATPKRKFQKSKKVSPTTPTEKDRRLDFFHGIGRVLYPKKTEVNKGFQFVHSVDDIIDSFASETSPFITQLHENYPGKFSNLEDLREAADRLSKSDLLLSRWQERDVFSRYSLGVAVRGLMVSNRVPQKGKFEAFRRSQTSRVELDSKAQELEGKVMFSELRVLDYQCLVDILPYARLLLPNLNQGQLGYVKKTSAFNRTS